MNETPLAIAHAALREPARLLGGALVQVFLFEGDRYLGWDCFDKDRVLMGGGPGDDLVLEGMGDLGIQLVVNVVDERLVLHNPAGSGRVRVNDEVIGTRALGPLDVVTVGPYTAKIRLKRIDGSETWQPESEDETPTQACEAHGAEDRRSPSPSRLSSTPAIEPAVPPSAETPEPPAGRSPPLAESPSVLDDPRLLEQFHVLLENVTADADAEARRAAETLPGPTDRSEPSDRPEPANRSSAPNRVAAASWTMPPLVHVPDDEPDEDEAEDREATFTLLDLVVRSPASDHRPTLEESVLQVARSRGDQLLDLALLDRGARYPHPERQRRAHPLVQRDQQGRSYLILGPEDGDGHLTLTDGRRLSLSGLLTPATRLSRRRQLYRVELPAGARAELQAGRERLDLTTVPRRESPAQPPALRRRRGVARHLATSSLVHVLTLMLGSLFVSLPGTHEPPPPETRFVQLDLEQLKPPPAPKPPEAKPAKPEPATTQVAAAPRPEPKPKRKLKPKQVQTRPDTKLPTPSPRKAQPVESPAVAVAPAKGPGSAAASPKAGGGHGGNVRNRNIKKTGLLGALGIPDGIQLGASEAMAAVTNLDVVASARSSEAGLKVGGIVGSLGSDRVEMPGVGLVNTKGSAQVVASAGIGGDGQVAALARGKTGETRVRALVTADIKAPVNVSGGMSREEVKRVIDAHLDEVSYCYETALLDDPGLMGRMAFEWRILITGRVGEVNIQSSSIQSDTLHACIKRAIHSWQFPEPRGAEVLVSYPFVFDVVGF